MPFSHCGGIVWLMCGNPSARWFQFYSTMPLFYITAFVRHVNIATSSNSRLYHHFRDQCRALSQKGFGIPSPLPLGKSPVGSLATSTPEFTSYDLTLFTQQFSTFLLYLFVIFLLYGPGPFSIFIPHHSLNPYLDHRPFTRTYQPGSSLHHNVIFEATFSVSRRHQLCSRQHSILSCNSTCLLCVCNRTTMFWAKHKFFSSSYLQDWYRWQPTADLH
jgi:hypothetical protein